MARLLTRVGHRFWRPWLRRRLGRVVLEWVEGVPLVVLPEVFNPAVFRSGALLARALASAADFARGGPGPGRALDLGTGSGVGAVFAALGGYRVVAVDVNPQAVRCARINALLNRLEESIEVRQGDLFEPVRGERFDLVLFNPPYFAGESRSDLDRAWRSPDVLARFAAGLPAALAPGGRALVVLSTDGEGGGLLEALAAGGFAVEVAARRAYGTETLSAYAVTAP